MTPDKLFKAARDSAIIRLAIEQWRNGSIPSFEAMLIELVLLLDRHRTGTAEDSRHVTIQDLYRDIRDLESRNRERMIEADAGMMKVMIPRCYRCKVVADIGHDSYCSSCRSEMLAEQFKM